MKRQVKLSKRNSPIGCLLLLGNKLPLRRPAAASTVTTTRYLHSNKRGLLDYFSVPYNHHHHALHYLDVSTSTPLCLSNYMKTKQQPTRIVKRYFQISPVLQTQVGKGKSTIAISTTETTTNKNLAAETKQNIGDKFFNKFRSYISSMYNYQLFLNRKQRLQKNKESKTDESTNITLKQQQRIIIPNLITTIVSKSVEYSKRRIEESMKLWKNTISTTVSNYVTSWNHKIQQSIQRRTTYITETFARSDSVLRTIWNQFYWWSLAAIAVYGISTTVPKEVVKQLVFKSTTSTTGTTAPDNQNNKITANSCNSKNSDSLS